MEKRSVFMSAKEVSDHYFHGKVSYRNVLKMTQDGKLPAIRSGKHYVYFSDALEAWVKRNFFTPAQTPIKK